MTDEEPIEVDALFLGMTRPPMAFGVTYTFLVINLMAATMAFLALNSLFAFLIGVPVHIAGYLLCLKDPRLFDIWRVRLLKTPPNRNQAYWRANSYSP